MVGLLETPDVLLKGFKFIARVFITPSNKAVLSAASRGAPAAEESLQH